jgi:hypothetical protein
VKASNAEGAPPGNATAGDQFGTALSLSQEGTTLVVGAIGEDGDAQSAIIAANGNADATNNLAPDAGAAYVFTRTGNNTWMQRAYVKASNAGTLDNFASALAISTNGSTIAVGARQEDGDSANAGDPTTDNDNLQDSGAAYVFVGRGDTWERQSYLKAPHAAPMDRFGWSLALSGSGDTLAVTAPFEAGKGAAHLFTRNGTQWSSQSDVMPSDTTAAGFGLAVSLARDGRTLAAGAPAEFAASGAAFLYVQVGTAWKEQVMERAGVADINDQFGIGLALSADGRSLFVGAPGESGDAQSTEANPNDNAPRAGAVYEF